MNVDEQVDRLLQSDKPKERVVKKHFRLNKRNFFIGFGSMIITALLMTMLVIPISRELMSKTFFGAGEETVSSTGDELNNTPAYHYWYAPENSFGIQEMKAVNWTYFQQLFNEHFYKNARYKRYSYSEWTDGTQYLTLNKTWNESGFWKVDIILDVPVDLYSVNVSFGCDLPVLNYIEREGHEIYLNYTANATETYQLVFNWSDIAQIPNLEIYRVRQDGKFWISFKRDNISTGHYEFDPTFGYSYTSDGYGTIENSLKGSCATPISDGTSDNITAYLATNGPINVSCALYNNATKAFIGSSEVRIIDTDSDYSWQVFDITETISTEIEYLIVAWAKAEDPWCNIGHSTDEGSLWTWRDGNTGQFNWPNPTVESEILAQTTLIYCSYTVSGAEQWQVINNTINGSIYNQSQISVISNTINGSLWNVSAMSVFNNTINGSAYNTSQVSVINNIINGSIYNSSTLSVISNTVNGSIWNISAYVTFSDTINGSIYNLSLYTSVNSSINGSIYNASQVSVISNTINGSLWNVSAMSVFNNTINGSAYNTSQVSVINNIINGSIYNSSTLSVISNTVNGSIWNISAYVTFSDTINGSIYNSSPYTIIQSDINGSLYNVTPPGLDITLEYPSNESNILIVQPTLYFNLTSPTGSLMNYTIWVGTSSGNCNIKLYDGVNVTNGTQFDGDHLYYSAVNFTTSYWWRVSANDGTTSINETFYFQSVRQASGMSTGGVDPIAVAALMFGILGFIAFMVVMRKRKKR